MKKIFVFCCLSFIILCMIVLILVLEMWLYIFCILFFFLLVMYCSVFLKFIKLSSGSLLLFVYLKMMVIILVCVLLSVKILENNIGLNFDIVVWRCVFFFFEIERNFIGFLVVLKGILIVVWCLLILWCFGDGWVILLRLFLMFISRLGIFIKESCLVMIWRVFVLLDFVVLVIRLCWLRVVSGRCIRVLVIVFFFNIVLFNIKFLFLNW